MGKKFKNRQLFSFSNNKIRDIVSRFSSQCQKSSMLRNSWGLIFISYVLLVTYWIDIDLVSPALPNIAASLNVPDASAHNIVSFDLFVRCLCLFIIGPISDVSGRKMFILYGAIAAMIGSLICLFSDSLSQVYIGKIMQGAGCSMAMLLYSIITDRYSNKESASIIAFLQFLLLSSIVIAPIIGSNLTFYFGWKYIFLFLALIALASTISCLKIKETPVDQPKKITFTAYKDALLAFSSMKYIIVYSISIAGYVLWTVTGPFILRDRLGMDIREIGRFQAFIATASAVTSIYIGFRIRKVGLSTVFKNGLGLMYSSSILIFLLVVLLQTADEYILLTLITAFSISVDMIICSSLTLFYKSFKSGRGVAAAINTIADNTITAVVLTLFGLLGRYTLVNYASALLLIVAITFIMLNTRKIKAAAQNLLFLLHNQK